MTQETPIIPAGYATLQGWGVIRVEGEDAASFLHGQLTQDFSLLGSEQARLAAYCSPKGRMLASFVGFKRSANEIVLVADKSVIAATVKRLSMFVMRAKVKLSDASDEFTLLGEILPGDTSVCTPWSLTSTEDGRASVELYPSLGARRLLHVVPNNAEGPASPPASATALTELLWRWAEVRSGVALITAPLADALVPQMLNYESVGGVSFKKGCYPGQEVVARSQFRGTRKRCAYIIRSEAEMSPGQEVFASSDPEQPCGVVAAAAAAPDGQWEALASLQMAAATDDTLQVNGHEAVVLPLPYTLLEDI
ncbi:folate-binding protein [Hydrogenophaga sp. 5NK40-0174]|uniref:CAF17-like 4Fe-4S cluster assembly/insertion protein YgfZ n=1 Tax=Hydrogenophaga sp. 5NK40-0174 TaxID=3127649 RepID=UPI00310ACB5C